MLPLFEHDRGHGSSHGAAPQPAPATLYRHLTCTIMPQMARTTHKDWPVRHDHCFQRIVLDTICGGVWYDHIARPAIRHLTLAQASKAADLCEDIIAGKADLAALNRQSLRYRGKLPACE